MASFESEVVAESPGSHCALRACAHLQFNSEVVAV